MHDGVYVDILQALVLRYRHQDKMDTGYSVNTALGQYCEAHMAGETVP